MPTTTPAYSSYQPTPTQGYQASEAAQPAASWDKGWRVLWGWAVYPNSAIGSLSRREDGLISSRSPDLLLLLWDWAGVRSSSGLKGLVWRWRHCCLRHLSPASPTDCSLTVAEHPSHLPGTPVGHHGLHGQPVCLHGLPALQHAGERSLPGPAGTRQGWATGAILGEVCWRLGAVATALCVLHVPQPL